MLWKIPGYNNPNDVTHFDVIDFHSLTSVKRKSVVPDGVTSPGLLCFSVYQDIVVHPF